MDNLNNYLSYYCNQAKSINLQNGLGVPTIKKNLFKNKKQYKVVKKYNKKVSKSRKNNKTNKRRKHKIQNKSKKLKDIFNI
ncbi:MAG: hypothetical protein ACREQ5_34980 [Candidatus Dormibacteria bacterium]